MTELNHNQSQGNKQDGNSSDISWLKELGIQSWQAELAISGLVITGLFQLPSLFIKWIEPFIIKSNDLEVTFLKIASAYILSGIQFLIIIFAIHLFLRGIWIALLGLNSAYPDGIDVNSKNGMGEAYWKDAKEKFPNLTAYNSELDKICSVMFSVATMIIIVFGSIAVMILIFYYLGQLLMTYFPSIKDKLVFVGIGFYALFVVILLLLQYLGKKYPDNVSVKKLISFYGIISSSIFSLYFLRKPLGYISSILTSNGNSKYGKYIMGLIFVFMGYNAGEQLGAIESANNFNSEKYFTFNNNEDQILNLNYENLIGEDTYVYTPIIQSDVINDAFIKLFIPIIKRESEHIKHYSIYERIKMSRMQKEDIKKEEFTAYKKLNKIYLNGFAHDSLNFQYYKHEKSLDKGLLVYIPANSCRVGRNILEIRKDYFSKDSVQKIVKIPFYFSK